MVHEANFGLLMLLQFEASASIEIELLWKWILFSVFSQYVLVTGIEILRGEMVLWRAHF
jgi:hypothetical protein